MIVLITGASSGIGRATAKYLDSLGNYELVLLSRSLERLESVQEELKKPAELIPFDLTRLEEIEQVFLYCKKKGIKLDGMVHSAGIDKGRPVRNNTIELTTAMMQSNFYPFMELGKFFYSRNYSNDGASIVALSSISSFTCFPGSINYTTSKAALNAAVTVMAKEFSRRKIRVNAILPAGTHTPMGPAEDDPAYLELQTLGVIKPEYVAYLVEFLLSEKAKYMTGTLIPISAGMSF